MGAKIGRPKIEPPYWPPCAFCPRPTKRDPKRGRFYRTCGDKDCLKAAAMQNSQNAGHKTHQAYVVHWPEITGKDTADFSPYEIEPGDGGIGRPIRYDDKRTYGGVSSGWIAR